MNIIQTLSIAGLLGLSSPGAWALDVQSANGISWVGGGVGEDERSEMQLLLPDYNLMVRTAVRSGEFIADVRVELRDAHGNVVAETVLDGPMLIARMAPGHYELRLTYGGATQSRKLSIPKSGRREVIIYWDASMAVELLRGDEEHIFSTDGHAWTLSGPGSGKCKMTKPLIRADEVCAPPVSLSD